MLRIVVLVGVCVVCCFCCFVNFLLLLFVLVVFWFVIADGCLLFLAFVVVCKLSPSSSSTQNHFVKRP